MSGPNRTVAAFRRRTLYLVEEKGGIATREAADSVAREMREKRPSASVRVRKYRIGPRARPIVRFFVRAYERDTP